MAKFSKKLMGKEVGSADVYAKPHTMDGKETKMQSNPGIPPNRSVVGNSDMSVGQYSQSAGNEPTKKTGIKIRGTGCATKGVMARGPMA